MDDLLIYSQTEEHLKHLELIFLKFREVGIKLKMSKCEFFKNEIECLGHIVSSQGISPETENKSNNRLGSHNKYC